MESYKDDSFTNNIFEYYNENILNVDDGNWNVNQENKNKMLPDNPEEFGFFIQAQINILNDKMAEYKTKLEVMKNIYDNLNIYRDFFKIFSFDISIFQYIKYVIAKDNDDEDEDENQNNNINSVLLCQAILLLKLLITNVKSQPNWVELEILPYIHKCLRSELPFSIAAELIDTLAFLASLKDSQILSEMFRSGVVSTICDILSVINPNIAPSRVDKPLEELPYVSSSINSEIHLLHYPLLAFIFYIFKWPESLTYNVLDELIEHALGLLTINLDDREIGCLMNTLMDLSSIQNDMYVLKKAIKGLGGSAYNFIMIQIKRNCLNVQMFAAQTIINFLLQNCGEALIKKSNIEDIFSLLMSNECNPLLQEKLLLIIECITYFVTHDKYIRKTILPNEIIDVFELRFLMEMSENCNYVFKTHIAVIFCNLLDSMDYREVIVPEIPFLRIFLPLLQTGKKIIIVKICELLIDIIRRGNNAFAFNFCSLIKDEGILDEFEEYDKDCDKQIYMEMTALRKEMNDVFIYHDQLEKKE